MTSPKLAIKYCSVTGIKATPPGSLRGFLIQNSHPTDIDGADKALLKEYLNPLELHVLFGETEPPNPKMLLL